MYRILGESKIVVNRHGEVAQGFANNMRLYEATLMGAVLVTEDAENLHKLFPSCTVWTYHPGEPEDLVAKVRWLLANPTDANEIAGAGRKITLHEHTFAKRMRYVLDQIQEMRRESKNGDREAKRARTRRTTK
jgi:spore maturation protein CgeB